MGVYNVSKSMETSAFTYSYSKLSCIAEMHIAHVFFAYVVCISGILCILTRIIPQTTWLHYWFGRVYIISMLWATATSLLINNTGLPVAVLISFVWVMGGLSLGWVVINIHQQMMEWRARRNVQEAIKLKGVPADFDLNTAINAEKARIAANKTVLQRIFSLKALHGSLFVTSWINIAGRVLATGFNDTENWVCYTYPYYKADVTTEYHHSSTSEWIPVPIENPDYHKQPWAKMGIVNWGAALSVGVMFGCYVIGISYALLETCCCRKRLAVQDESESVLPLAHAQAPIPRVQ